MMFLLLASLVQVAHAGPIEAAEHRRLADEMKAAAGRSLWTAVEEDYLKLRALEDRGESLTVLDQWLGAQSARALGDIRGCRERLDHAARAGGSREVIAWLEEIDASYGQLRVTVDPAWVGDRALVPATPPFAPDQRASIDFATRALVGGSFEGLVPAGSYRVGGHAVEVATGGAVAALSLVAPKVDEPRRTGPYRLAYAGPRATLGYSYTAVGALNGNGDSAAGGLQAVGFSGSGARLGVGLEVGFTRHVGAIAEVGYHNLFAPAQSGGEPLADSGSYEAAGNSLHLGYGWLAGSLRFGDLWIAAGPLWAAGGGSVTGVTGYCVGQTDTTGPCADEFPALGDEEAAYQRLTGKITAGGAALGVSYGIVDIGKLRGAITVNGGMQTDSFRWYPWGQAAFTLAPASARKGKDG